MAKVEYPPSKRANVGTDDWSIAFANLARKWNVYREGVGLGVGGLIGATPGGGAGGAGAGVGGGSCRGSSPGSGGWGIGAGGLAPPRKGRGSGSGGSAP